MQSKSASLCVDEQQRAVLVFQELHELRRRDSELFGCPRDVAVARIQHVEGFCEKRCEVIVSRIAADLSTVAPRPPQLGRSRFGQRGGSDGECEVDPQSPHRDTMVVMLAAPLGRLACDARRRVEQYDGRFGLVAVLPARSAPSLVTDLAGPQQQLD